jgi:hypothetical protein
MSWTLNTRINARVRRLVAQGGQTQRGAFSPLLFGMLLGMGLFSIMSMELAKKELIAYQKVQAERARAQADDLAKAMDFAILTEDKHSYSDEYSLQRARAYSNTAAKTRGNQDFLLNARESQNAEQFGQNRVTVAIAATDDTLLRSQVFRSTSARDLQEISSSHPVALYDTSMARDRQVKDSKARMEILAEQVYAFVAAHGQFPTSDEFEKIASRAELTDVWGQPFTYTAGDDKLSCKLSFTTPWDYTQTLKLDLKDDTKPDEEDDQ